MQLSVVILNYNVRYFLELCLKSVQAAISDIDAEIIVVDNRSDDDSCEMAKMLFPDVVLIENTENYGFSKGNNIGVKSAKGDYVCILNPDTVVAEDTFIQLLAFAQSKNDLGIVGCKLIDGKGHFLPESKRNVPTPLVSIKKILGHSNGYYANYLGEDETGEVSILVGAFMLLKRSVYNQVKGFDEDYFMYGDDMDLSFRIQKAGFKNYYHPKTTIIHYKGESTMKDKVYAKRFNEAMQLFFRKHFKPNLIYNSIIDLGIKALIALNPSQNVRKTEVASYVMFSESESMELKSQLEKPIHISSDKLEFKDHQEFIFNSENQSFKDIIQFMQFSSKKADLSFKIQPKGSRFIIGSNSSKGRGEIITF